MRHPALTDELSERAALYALGLLEGEEARDFERHLEQERCPACRSEVAALRGTAGAMAHAAAAAPPPRLRERLLAAIADPGPQVWKAWSAPPQDAGMHVVRAREGAWQTVCPGVTAKQLFADPERDSVTMLIRMEPGSTYPPHRHGGPEQCLVLEGDLQVNDMTFHAGDYQCMLRDSIHDVTRTNSGCLLLIVSSQHDELLA